MHRAPREREGERASERLRKGESEKVREIFPVNLCFVSIENKLLKIS